MDFKKLKVLKVDNSPVIYPITGSCLDCEWNGLMADAEIDYCGDYDEFKGINIPTPICPNCGGGVEVN